MCKKTPLFFSYFALFYSILFHLLLHPLNIYIYTLGLDYYPGIITHPGGLVPSSWHFTVSATPGQGGCGRAQSSLFRPVAFSPVWGRIECGMGNPLGDQALTLHTRNRGGTICSLVFEICFLSRSGLGCVWESGSEWVLLPLIVPSVVAFLLGVNTLS